MNQLRIVFMGTPEFAVGILDSIIKHNYNVVGVITAPDKPAGRGQKLKLSAVKEYALANNLKILQPLNLKDDIFLEELRALEANLQVVVAFRMLPDVVWKMPELGTFNLHASLLPNYRGAAPINWAIINGDEKTGVTTFFIDEQIDTGAVILSRETDILPTENAGSLHDRLMKLGSEAVVETLEMIANGKVLPKKQEILEEHKTASKLNKDNCKIDWSASGIEIYNLIRGLSPYPGAWCFIIDGENTWNVKIYGAEFLSESQSEKIGKIITEKRNMKIAVKDGWLVVHAIQFPGKKKMPASELLNGMTFSGDAYAG